MKTINPIPLKVPRKMTGRFDRCFAKGQTYQRKCEKDLEEMGYVLPLDSNNKFCLFRTVMGAMDDPTSLNIRYLPDAMVTNGTFTAYFALMAGGYLGGGVIRVCTGRPKKVRKNVRRSARNFAPWAEVPATLHQFFAGLDTGATDIAPSRRSS